MYDNCDDPDILGEIERCITLARMAETPYIEYGQVADSDESGSDSLETERELTMSTELETPTLLPASVRIYLVSYLRAYRSLC